MVRAGEALFQRGEIRIRNPTTKSWGHEWKTWGKCFLTPTRSLTRLSTNCHLQLHPFRTNDNDNNKSQYLLNDCSVPGTVLRNKLLHFLIYHVAEQPLSSLGEATPFSDPPQRLPLPIVFPTPECHRSARCQVSGSLRKCFTQNEEIVLCTHDSEMWKQSADDHICQGRWEGIHLFVEVKNTSMRLMWNYWPILLFDILLDPTTIWLESSF